MAPSEDDAAHIPLRYDIPDELDFDIPFDSNTDITRVRDDLYVGSAFAAQNPDELVDRGIEHVVTLSESPTFTTSDHAPIRDGSNPPDDFATAVAAVRRAINAPLTAFIHCNAGVSRAPTVTATALAELERRPFDEALDEVRECHSNARPHSGLLKTVETYLNG